MKLAQGWGPVRSSVDGTIARIGWFALFVNRLKVGLQLQYKIKTIACRAKQTETVEKMQETEGARVEVVHSPSLPFTPDFSVMVGETNRIGATGNGRSFLR